MFWGPLQSFAMRLLLLLTTATALLHAGGAQGSLLQDFPSRLQGGIDHGHVPSPVFDVIPEEALILFPGGAHEEAPALTQTRTRHGDVPVDVLASTRFADQGWPSLPRSPVRYDFSGEVLTSSGTADQGRPSLPHPPVRGDPSEEEFMSTEAGGGQSSGGESGSGGGLPSSDIEEEDPVSDGTPGVATGQGQSSVPTPEVRGDPPGGTSVSRKGARRPSSGGVPRSSGGPPSRKMPEGAPGEFRNTQQVDASSPTKPYVVSLRRQSDFGYFCAGALIGRRHVLTAAHCLDSSLPGGDTEPEVVVGSAQLSLTSGPDIQVISTESVHFSPETPEGSSGLAILKLAKRANEAPIRLPRSSGAKPKAGENLVGIGWGRTSPQSGFSDVVQIAQSSFIPRDACSESLGKDIAPLTLCTGGRGGSSCRGDDGGPIVAERNPDVLVGVIGSEHVCGKRRASAHLAVAPLLDWIKTTRSNT